MKVFVSTHPFSSTSQTPLELLKSNEIDVILNSHERKITTRELASDIGNSDVLIAGTERITEEVIKNAPNLKLISRVGVGLDGVNFELCNKYGIKVTYTPDAPTMAVAELCVGIILDLSRKISYTDRNVRKGVWDRYMGNLLYGKTVGIFGMGRIGKSLVHLLSSFNVKFLVNDITPDFSFGRLYNIEFVSKNDVLEKSDIISINIPLKKDTYDFITLNEIKKMRSNAILINTARGGIVNESDLYEALKNSMISGAGIDVFEEEPYKGKLTELGNCVLTCHVGASTINSRTEMETQAVEEVIRFKNERPLKNEVFANE
ncbi:phosphoglycerate dehydrogenase [Methanococcoides burtonii]|uniref:D-3-phosphoglycerate dehydrogenase n=1 Tax=Methanococcoides burtonii (strain DSM 6242 / NBRC 107633 / OCM 468 / ACE-M) TaxID=259564 RepID=Q12VM6_METBU|nr:phosphoglycerate dehydrogenase [Methanococcoides burtonii]ABE52500.1 D-3-phosphoglycerate dehydrogenase [Methanococcoides burtonii DSM 6242]